MLQRNLQGLTICQSINKTPINTQPDIKTGIRIAGSRKIVRAKTKPMGGGNCIEIFCPEKCPEITNAEM